VRHLAAHPRDRTCLLSGGDDGSVALVELGPTVGSGDGSGDSLGDGGSDGLGGGGGGGRTSTLYRPRRERLAPTVTALAFDPETNYAAAALDDAALLVLHRHPRLTRGARYA
jgi:hypothetical protein